MDKNMLANSIKEIIKAKGTFSIRIFSYMKAVSVIINLMVWESIIGRMAKGSKVIIKMEKNTVKGYFL
jgi:hypothetical protein